MNYALDGSEAKKKKPLQRLFAQMDLLRMKHVHLIPFGYVSPSTHVSLTLFSVHLRQSLKMYHRFHN